MGVGVVHICHVDSDPQLYKTSQNILTSQYELSTPLCRQVCNPILSMSNTTADADHAAKVARMLMMPSLCGVLTTCTFSSVIDQKILFKVAGTSLVKLQWAKYAHRESHTRNFNADDVKPGT